MTMGVGLRAVCESRGITTAPYRRRASPRSYLREAEGEVPSAYSPSYLTGVERQHLIFRQGEVAAMPVTSRQMQEDVEKKIISPGRLLEHQISRFGQG